MRITRLGWIIPGASLLTGTIAFVLWRGQGRGYVISDGSGTRVHLAGASTVDLTITLEEAHTEEFVFKPDVSRDKP